MVDKYIEEMRAQHVRKSNTLIQQTRYNVSAKQFDIITFLISKVKPTDERGKLYTFSIRDFCKVCGIDYNNGWHYTNIKKELTAIAQICVWITLDNGKEALARWFDELMIDRGNGNIEVSFHKTMCPYIYEVSRCFADYPSELIYALKSKYSKYLYDFLKSYQNMRHLTFSIDEVKEAMRATNYTVYKDFKKRALNVAIEEINATTDINVSYKARKIKSQFYTHIEFEIKAITVGEDIAHRISRQIILDGEEIVFKDEVEAANSGNDMLPF